MSGEDGKTRMGTEVRIGRVTVDRDFVNEITLDMIRDSMRDSLVDLEPQAKDRVRAVAKGFITSKAFGAALQASMERLVDRYVEDWVDDHAQAIADAFEKHARENWEQLVVAAARARIDKALEEVLADVFARFVAKK